MWELGGVGEGGWSVELAVGGPCSLLVLGDGSLSVAGGFVQRPFPLILLMMMSLVMKLRPDIGLADFGSCGGAAELFRGQAAGPPGHGSGVLGDLRGRLPDPAPFGHAKVCQFRRAKGV